MKKMTGWLRFLKAKDAEASPSRDWILKNEGKLTLIQLFGLILIILGIVYFASFLLPTGFIEIFKALDLDEHADSNEVPLAFFTIMLGVSFAFPDMLKGQTKEISTMRIIVFMFANVICMLLLKIGWDKTSLNQIGLDGYWMGVIAFLFGAKATQSYFENAGKLAQAIEQNNKPSHSNTPEEKPKPDISPLVIAQIAKVQNETNLQTKFPNITSISDTLSDGESCVILYLEDNNQKGLPEYVMAEINESTKIKVKTEIVSNAPAAKIHLGQAYDEISDASNPKGYGSFCTLLTNSDNPDYKFLATAGHNFTKGKFKSMGGFVYGDDQKDVLLNGQKIGSLFYQRMHFTQDLAIVKLDSNSGLLNNYISFKNGFKELTVDDVAPKRPNVTIASRKNDKRIGSNVRDAYILDINTPFDIMYNGENRRFLNVILLGNTNIRDESKEVSMRGDSGSCVYCNKTQKLIGILVGGNGKFSFVLPLKDLFELYNFKLI